MSLGSPNRKRAQRFKSISDRCLATLIPWLNIRDERNPSAQVARRDHRRSILTCHLQAADLIKDLLFDATFLNDYLADLELAKGCRNVPEIELQHFYDFVLAEQGRFLNKRSR